MALAMYGCRNALLYWLEMWAVSFKHRFIPVPPHWPHRGLFCTATLDFLLLARLVISSHEAPIFLTRAFNAPLAASVRVADFLRNHAQMARIRLFLFPLALRLALRASSCCTKQPSVLRVLLERSQLQVF